MSVLLVTPSNSLHTPYVDNYTKILLDNNIPFNVVVWDRFHIEKVDALVYRDKKVGHTRNILDYLKYSVFVKKILKNNDYEHVIIFGLQVFYFLNKYLNKEFARRYILDVRDHNKIINFFNLTKAIEKAKYIVVSSKGYLKWLPDSDNYVINHNTNISSYSNDVEKNFMSQELIKIGCIGALRDYKINSALIEELRDNNMFELNYHGEGVINDKLQFYLNSKRIKNVKITGRYLKDEENNLFKKNDMINVLRYNDGINNYSALPNRLYNAVIVGKPLLAYEGTYLASLIKKHKLGLVVSNFSNMEEKITRYTKNYNHKEFMSNRDLFLDLVIMENKYFEDIIKEL